MTKKLKIYYQLEQEIINNDFQKLPSERMLAIKFKISRSIIREVLNLLLIDGYIIVKKNVGYFVNDKQEWNKSISISKKHKEIFTSLHHNNDKIPNFIFSKFKFKTKNFIGFRKNIFYREKPIEYLDFWIPFYIFKNIDIYCLKKSISETLKTKFNAKHCKNWIKIEKANLFDKTFFKNQNLNQIICIYSIIFTNNDEIIQVSLTKKLINNFEFPFQSKI